MAFFFPPRDEVLIGEVHIGIERIPGCTYVDYAS
jgi:hypothetical protein